MAVFEYGIDNKPGSAVLPPSGTNPVYTAPDFAGAVHISHGINANLQDQGYGPNAVPLDKYFQMVQDQSNFSNAVTLTELQAQLNNEAADHSLENYYESLQNAPINKLQGMTRAGINPLIATGSMAGGNPNPAPVGGVSPQSFNSTPTTHKDKFDKASSLLLGIAAIVGAVSKLI